jgi:hypothetical protein
MGMVLDFQLTLSGSRLARTSAEFLSCIHYLHL